MQQSTIESLVKVRHVAADCMHMSTTVLGGISARYNIDNLTLLKFYTACGQKYASDLCDMEMADVCFSRAAEFAQTVLKEDGKRGADPSVLARAMFDLLLGRAECSWEKGDSKRAEDFVSRARKYLDHLPGEHEFLASVEYNFGLFTYQAKETESALKWLKRSIETRENECNQSKDHKKQARTVRLAGVCLLALQKYEASWKMMKDAEDICHDPIGAYLLLKLSIITKQPQSLEILLKAIDDVDSSLDVCIASISLFGDAQRISDAATGFERLYKRFRNNPVALACTIGPRYFETLVAIGKIDQALELFEVCSSIISTLSESDEVGGTDAKADSTQPAQLTKWAALLLATGSAQADKRDFSSATIILSNSLLLAKKAKDLTSNVASSSADPQKGCNNVVLENEAAVCRLASSCALCSIDDSRRSVSMSLQPGSAQADLGSNLNEKQKSMIAASLKYASRAKELEPNDFAPRLLLFRAHLISHEYSMAAQELKRASEEISSFDPGALAEAACAARDVGSITSVVAALRCILNMNPETFCKGFEASALSVPNGFFGTVLLSCVNLLLREKESDSEEELPRTDGETLQNENSKKYGDAEELLHVLQAGLRGLRTIGVEKAFDIEQRKDEASITYLMSVAWNAGRDAGTELAYEKWEAFFSLSYELSMYLPTTTATLQTRRMSKVMCSCAVVENQVSGATDFTKAIEQVKEARSISYALRELAPTVGDDPIEGLLLTLEARCCVGCQDLVALAGVVDRALRMKEIGAGVLEQLAAICYHFRATEGEQESEQRARCVDLTTALLARASDARLCDGEKNLEALATTMREQLGIELSRGSTAARGFVVFQKCVGVVLEYNNEFPDDERRWLVAVGWDRAQMYSRLGQKSEAKRWCESVLRLVEGSMTLSTYRPRLANFMESLR